ncbi:MAG: MFS transporter [Pseudomonadota bacterium]
MSSKELENNEDAWPNSGQAWVMIIIMTIAYVFSFIDRMIFGLLIAPIRAEFAINDTVFSLLYGLGFAFFYTVVGVPLGWVADRYNRRNLAAIGIAAWSVMTAACGLAKNFSQLAIARILVGVGEATLTPATYSMAGDSFPAHKLGRALSVFVIGWPLGIGLALIIGGLVIEFVSSSSAYTLPLLGEIKAWQVCFLVVGLPGVLIAALTLFLPEPRRRSAQSSKAGSLSAAFKHLRTYWQAYASLTVGFSMLSIVMNTYQLWGVQVFVRVHNLSISTAGLMVGCVIAIAGTAGILTGGWLNDRFRASGHDDAALRIGLIAATVMLPFAASATLVNDPNLACALMIPIGFFTSFGFGASGAALVLLTPPNLRGMVSAVYLFVINMLAMGVGPLLTALLNDHLFESDLAVDKSVAIVATTSLIISIGLFIWGFTHFKSLSELTPVDENYLRN